MTEYHRSRLALALLIVVVTALAIGVLFKRSPMQVYSDTVPTYFTQTIDAGPMTVEVTGTSPEPIISIPMEEIWEDLGCHPRTDDDCYDRLTEWVENRMNQADQKEALRKDSF
jgi:hypothetical protein